MENGDRTLATLDHLRNQGIGIAIDDFGTGYSSMSQLKNMPVTKLKIDKSFVDDITSKGSDRAITAAMTNLAHNLNIEVIAEGVESREQVALLRQVGCHEFQGYYFSRPLTAAQVPGFLENFQQDQEKQQLISPQAPLSFNRVASAWGELT